MDIERLKELKDMINQDYMTEDLYSGRDVISEDGEDLISLIDEKISKLQKEPCEYCKDGVYYDVLGSPCKYNNCPMCGRKLR